MSEKKHLNQEQLKKISGGETGDLNDLYYKCNECNEVWKYDGEVDKCKYCGSTKISKFKSSKGIAPIY